MRNLWGRHARRFAVCATAGLAGIWMPSASAFEIQLGDTTVKLDNLFTVGGVMRTQKRDPSLVGKSSLNPTACVGRVGDDHVHGASTNRPDNTYSGNTCNPEENDSHGFANANAYFVSLPGSFNPNGDNGDLNFDKGDIVQATAKLTSDLSFTVFDFNFFARGLALFDNNYTGFEQTHPDTTFQPKHNPLPKASEDRLAHEYKVLDYFVSRTFDVSDHQLSVKVGSQVLNWGESSFLIANSLNSINPPDQARLRVPGFDIKELQQPQGMVVVNAELMQGVNLETFYQYQWRPVIADPVGSFFSQSDIVGEGASYAMLSFAKAPDDPLGLYAPRYNPDDPAFTLNSNSSRTLQVLAPHTPKDGGQYGAALKLFFDELNGGTEVGLYFANYHSRVPSISGRAAQSTCLPDSDPAGLPAAALALVLTQCSDLLSAQALPVALDIINTAAQNLPGTKIALTKEALPLDTAKLFLEYPENRQMYGISFNTTVGDWALSGEYVYRPNLPIQVHSTDLVFALLQPAFPANDLHLGIATLPGRRTAVPDFLQTTYRGVQTGAGDYVQGWVPMGIGQGELSLLKTFGGDNWLRASQISLLIEAGDTWVPNLPDLSELQTNGAGTDTHISSGADGTKGINPRDVRSTADTAGELTLHQNPTSWATHDIKGFGTSQSYGYRIFTLTRYDDALFGVNVEFLNAFFHDVKGVSPGLGQNFVEGRMQAISGIRLDYLSTFQGEVRYTWYFGGEHRDALRDRDNLLVTMGYQF